MVAVPTFFFGSFILKHQSNFVIGKFYRRGQPDIYSKVPFKLTFGYTLYCEKAT